MRRAGPDDIRKLELDAAAVLSFDWAGIATAGASIRTAPVFNPIVGGAGATTGRFMARAGAASTASVSSLGR